MEELILFIKKIAPKTTTAEINKELLNIDKHLVNYDFIEAVKFCMLKAYSYKETINIILVVNYNYDYLRLCLDFLQNQTLLEITDLGKFMSHFPKEKRWWKIILNELEYYFLLGRNLIKYYLESI